MGRRMFVDVYRGTAVPWYHESTAQAEIARERPSGMPLPRLAAETGDGAEVFVAAQDRQAMPRAAIHASFAGMGRPSFFNATCTRAYASVAGWLTERMSNSGRWSARTGRGWGTSVGRPKSSADHLATSRILSTVVLVTATAGAFGGLGGFGG